MAACLLYYTSSHVLRAQLKIAETSLFQGMIQFVHTIAVGKIPQRAVFCCENIHVLKSSSNVQSLQLFEETNCLTFPRHFLTKSISIQKCSYLILEFTLLGQPQRTLEHPRSKGSNTKVQ